MVVCHELAPDFVLRLAPAPQPAAWVSARTDEIWAELTAARPAALHDGPVTALLSHDPQTLVAYRTSYRHLTAARVDPAVADATSLRAIGVTGVTTCRDGVVLGRRAAAVAAAQGRWEPAPAGTLAQDDPRQQLLEELGEELGVPVEAVTSTSAIALLYDDGDKVYDVLYRLHLDLDGGSVRQLHDQHGSPEYSEIAVVPTGGLAVFLRDAGDAALPILRPALALAGLLAQG